jgi:3',5'-cyclic AMP phosphodiesterase CpdA
MPPKPLKFAVIADAHIGNAQATKPPTRFPDRARSLLRYVVSQLNSEYKPDFVVQLGDLIEAEDADEDEDNVSTAAEILRDLQMPVYHALGNHEQMHLSLPKVCSSLKMQKPFYSFRCAPLNGIVLCPEKSGDEWVIGKEQLKWIEQELRVAETQVLVYSHFPLVDFVSEDEAGDDSGEAPAVQPPSQLSNRADVRHLLAQSNKVRAVISAHWHKNSLEELGGIHYVSIQSLVQNVSGSRPSESFGVAKVFEDSVIVEVIGMDPAEFRF